MNILKLSILIICCLCNAVLAGKSTCYGTTSKGYLDLGIALPYSGGKFDGYSTVARLSGKELIQ